MFLLFLLFSFPSLYFVYISWCDVFSYGGTLFKSSAASSWGDRTPTRAHQHALSCITTKHVGIHHTASHSQTQNSTIYRLIIAVYLSWFVTIHLIEGVFFPRTKKLSPKVIPVSFIDPWSLVLFEAISFLNLIQLNISEFYNLYFVKCCLSKPTWFIIISWMSRASTM